MQTIAQKQHRENTYKISTHNLNNVYNHIYAVKIKPNLIGANNDLSPYRSTSLYAFSFNSGSNSLRSILKHN